MGFQGRTKQKKTKETSKLWGFEVAKKNYKHKAIERKKRDPYFQHKETNGG